MCKYVSLRKKKKNSTNCIKYNVLFTEVLIKSIVYFKQLTQVVSVKFIASFFFISCLLWLKSVKTLTFTN